MNVLADLRAGERRLTKRMASWDSPWARRVLPAVEEAVEHTKLWCAAALALGTLGGWRGRKAAGAGLAGMAIAETISNAVVKPLSDRRRPPKEWFQDQDVQDRPDSSSFPSGHTAAAVGFTAAIAPVWPWVGAVCAVPAVAVAAQRVHSGAHYPSDVVTGVVVGLAAAGLVRAAPRLLLHLR
ncbi:phosphatase PAP2 family protein [Streptomyces sp. NPDC048350]|uniref:phosphatase PAP2 family protein n=1 Tax=Streptomyces sp. NPDC048350 TaxID=3365538 RepID=UPI0037152007